MARDYSFRNPVIEPVRLNTLAALMEHFRMHGIPTDARLRYQGNPGEVTRVVRVEKTHDGVYVTLGGSQ